MMPGRELRELFATPVVMGEVADAAALNAELRAVILARQSAYPEGLSHSNVLGWHSDPLMAEWGGPAAFALARQVGELCFTASRDLKTPENPRYCWSVRMWANVSPPGASNQVHAHPGAFWSAVYYVDDGGCADNPALGGELFLLDPRYPMSAMASSDMAMCMADGAPMAHEHRIVPRAGCIVAVPAWLTHGVRPYLGTDLRISVAINLTLQLIPEGRPQPS